jgi:hypothetical protein
MSLFAVAFLLVLFVPAHAWAWGPITHLAHGAEVLENLTILGVSLQQLLRRERLAYLYGCIGADITQAKKYTRAQQAHCHSWEVGWELVHAAETHAESAFAYGYLTHLAGDVYSHNHFVPTQLVISFPARTLRHIYWEARFDAMQRAVGRRLIRELRGHRFPECDALVKHVVSRTLFSFRTDKRIFNSFIAVHDLEQWHRVMRRITANSRYALSPHIVTCYNASCFAGIVDVLLHGEHADCQGADPSGLKAITAAKRLRVRLRTLQRRGRLTEKLRHEIEALNHRPELEAVEPLPLVRASVGG